MFPPCIQNFSFLSNISVYALPRYIYIIGEEQGGDNCWRVLKVGRTLGPELDAYEDPTSYSPPQLRDLLNRLNIGNKSVGGLRSVAGPCPALLGCFYQSLPYLLLATRSLEVGTLCGEKVYSIEATALVPLSPPGHALQAEQYAAEAHARRLLSVVTETKDFYFSYRWPVWMTLQQALKLQHPPMDAFEDHRVWNAHLARPIFRALGHWQWAVPLVHGAWNQRQLTLPSGIVLSLTVLARRSRNFAGTRYHRRGVNSVGHVANDVEVEQIVEVFDDENKVSQKGNKMAMMMPKSVSSVVQVRGSVPLYWAQGWGGSSESSTLRPSIRMLHHLDPLHHATRRHFDDLRNRYGDPIACLDLLRQGNGRQERALGLQYSSAIAALNKRASASGEPGTRIHYVAWDLRRQSRYLGGDYLADLHRIQQPLLDMTGIYVAAIFDNRFSQNEVQAVQTQHGVLRTNCVDCLDRTNVGQFAYGLLALGLQLTGTGALARPNTGGAGGGGVMAVDPRSSLASELMSAYEAVGNLIAQQYGGSEAHTSLLRRWRGGWQAGHRGRELLTAIRRLYSNAITDDDKQAAINMFLGVGYRNEARESESQKDDDAVISSIPPALSLLRVHTVTPEPSGEMALQSASSTASLESSLGEESPERASLRELLHMPGEEGREGPGPSSGGSTSGKDGRGDRGEPATKKGKEPKREIMATTPKRKEKVVLESLDDVLADRLAATPRKVGLQAPQGWGSPSPSPHHQQQRRSPWLSPTQKSPEKPSVNESSPIKSSTTLMRSNSEGGFVRRRLAESDVNSVSNPQIPKRNALSSSGRCLSLHDVEPRAKNEDDFIIVGMPQLNVGLAGEGGPSLVKTGGDAKDLAPVLPPSTGPYKALESLNLEGARFARPGLGLIGGRSDGHHHGGTGGGTGGGGGDGSGSADIIDGGDIHGSALERHFEAPKPMSIADRVLSFAGLGVLRSWVSLGSTSHGGLPGFENDVQGQEPFLQVREESEWFGKKDRRRWAEERGRRRRHPSSGFGSTIGTMDFSRLMTQHHEVAHGLDDMGLPSAVAPLWRQGSNVVESFVEGRKRAEKEALKLHRRASTPMTVTEMKEQEVQAAEALRPRIILATGKNIPCAQ